MREAGPPGGKFEVIDGIGPARISEESPNTLELRLSDGSIVQTHGPDPARAYGFAQDLPLAGSQLPGDLPLPGGIGPYPGNDAASSNPSCVDPSASNYFQVLYWYPRNQADRRGTATDRIRDSVRKMNGIVYEATQESSNQVGDYRVRCTDSGQVWVRGFEGPNSNGEGFTQIINAARGAGFDRSDVKYLIYWDSPVFVDGDRACGQGLVDRDSRRSVNNANNSGGDYGTAYDNTDGCWSGVVAAHETGHQMGAVQPDAPRSTGVLPDTGSPAYHCWDEWDVMCYADGGSEGKRSDLRSRCANDEKFDCQYNDYFNAGAADGYLGTHWNIGWHANRFLFLR